MAAHSAYVIWYLRGRDDKGELFLLSDGLGVGYGARPTADGNDAVYLVAQENFPSEFLELGVPRARHALRDQPRHRRARALARRLRPHPRARGAGAGGHGLHAHRQRRASALGRRRRACGRHRALRRQSGPARRARPASLERRQHRQARRHRAHRDRRRAAAGAIPSTASPSGCWPTCAAASSAGQARRSTMAWCWRTTGSPSMPAATASAPRQAAGGQALPPPRLS